MSQMVLVPNFGYTLHTLGACDYPHCSLRGAVPAKSGLKVTRIKLNLTKDKTQATLADVCRASGGPPNHTDPLLSFVTITL